VDSSDRQKRFKAYGNTLPTDYQVEVARALPSLPGAPIAWHGGGHQRPVM